MSSTRTRLNSFSSAFLREFQEKEVTFLAASLAYYAFVSLIPLLLLVIVLASFAGVDVSGTVSDAVGGFLSPEASDSLSGSFSDQTGASLAGLVSVLVLLWSAIKVFRGLDLAFSRVYGRSGPDGIAEQVKNAVVTLGAVIVALLVTVIIGYAINAIDLEGLFGSVGLSWLVGVVGTVVSLVALAIALFPLYYLLPGGDLSVREAVPGAVFAAIGWTVFQTVFRLYSGSAGGTNAYGAIGVALLIVTLLYFGGLILLLGVVLNAVLGGRTASTAADSMSWGERIRTGGTHE